MTNDRKLAAALGALELEDAAIRRLEAQIQRVRELHKSNGRGLCTGCDTELDCWGCGEWGCTQPCECDCHPVWPCSTIKALDGEKE